MTALAEYVNVPQFQHKIMGCGCADRAPAARKQMTGI